MAGEREKDLDSEQVTDLAKSEPNKPFFVFITRSSQKYCITFQEHRMKDKKRKTSEASKGKRRNKDGKI